MEFIVKVLASTAVSTALIASLGWLAKGWISARLTKSIQAKYDKELEGLKTQLHEREIEFKMLRDGGFAGLTARAALQEKRRLDAVDQLWSAFHALDPAKGAVGMMSAVNIQNFAKATRESSALKEVFVKPFKDLDFKAIYSPDGWRARPHVSSLAWAIFSAYLAIIGLALAHIKMIELELDMTDTLNYDHVEGLIVEVDLPPLPMPSIKRKSGLQGYWISMLGG